MVVGMEVVDSVQLLEERMRMVEGKWMKKEEEGMILEVVEAMVEVMVVMEEVVGQVGE